MHTLIGRNGVKVCAGQGAFYGDWVSAPMRKVEFKDDTLIISFDNLQRDIGIPEVNLTITSTPVVARVRKLRPGAKIRWVVREEDQNLIVGH